MQKKNGDLFFSASDLSGFISCKHLTNLSIKAALGEISKPIRKSHLVETLQKRGDEFEQEYLLNLEGEGKSIVKVEKKSSKAFEETVEAMRLGVDVIYQARMELDNWQGWADFLIRVNKKSDFGDWSYEVYDTKLATSTKAGTILQIALYSEITASIQGVMPENMYVKHPRGTEEYRVLDYIAYYRVIKKNFLRAIKDPLETYPDPVSHCDVCNWWTECNKTRRDDDHLQFVAGLGKTQLQELRLQGINKLEDLANLPVPLAFQPNRGAVITYEKLRDQARLQLLVRQTNQPQKKLLDRFPERVPPYGFYDLPEPHKDDIFLDLEGDPLVPTSGREYIFGYVFRGEYHIRWAETEEAEKSAFQDFIDLAIATEAQSPDMHIYHFGAYETSAFKRLMLKYATRTEEMEQLLRSWSFVDLHQVVRQSLQAGVERYSLKDLEKYHGYIREADLRSVSPLKADYELLLETGCSEDATPEMREKIKTYNEDDCRSTEALFQWLCRLRQELRDNGEVIPAPPKPSGIANEKITQHQERVRPILDALKAGLPPNQSAFRPEHLAKYISWHLLDWYGRELKKVFWDKFRLEKAVEIELLEDSAALYGLDYTGQREMARTRVTDEYTFPDQECDIREGDDLLFNGFDGKSKVIFIDRNRRIIRINKPSKLRDVHPVSAFRYNLYESEEKINRIVQIGKLISERGINNPDLQCAIDLMLREKPRTSSEVVGNKSSLEGRLEWLLKLQRGVLPIQGPPGTGKTYNASRLIIGLIKAGKKIGVTALSHKVITNLLWGIHEAAIEANEKVEIIQKPERDSEEVVSWETMQLYDDIHSSISRVHVLAGTSNMWAHPSLENSVDYLFVDEAGQLSLADTLVCCFATKNLVLVGDPQQLRQPIQGVHPDGIDVSALEHIFQGAKTITTDQGIFLGTTWRMHPSICSFNSDLYYDGRLITAQNLEKQKISGNTQFSGSGLFYRPVAHQGNTTYSLEEVEEVVSVFNELTKGDVFWENADGEKVIVTPEHIKIITPYNSQRYELLLRLGGFKDIGTVDKFQGQEAPIVIYSMVTSTAEDIPRGMDFLYSPNRFNVAVSRAKAAFILIGSPKLFEPECKTPEQMKLANAFALFYERKN